MAKAGNGRWQVTVVAPTVFQGDVRPIRTEAFHGEECALRCVSAWFTKYSHVTFYGPALRHIVSEGWDLIHCWEEPFVVAGGQVAWLSPAGTPLVFSSYQNLDKRYPPPFAAIERYCIRKAAGWIGGGALVEDLLSRRRGYADKPHKVIPLGVDIEHFRSDAAVGAAVRRGLGWADENPPVIGFVGRFVEQKGLRLLTRVLGRIELPWRALFVGSGPLEKELRDWAQTRSEQVQVVTGVKHEDVWRYLNAVQVLCVPSQTTPVAREQFGRVIVEAFACGVPVLASDSGEMPHVIGDAGVVVGERDEDAWTEWITRLLSMPAERTELGAAGRRRAAPCFAWSVVAQRHLDFFESLLAMSEVS